MIIYHHIGGRNGTYPLPLKKSPLLNEFHLILYDADANCFEQMKEAEQHSWGKVDVYPYCIGGHTGTSSLHLNFHPTTNSLYSFNEAFKEYNFVGNPIYGEYVFGDACQPMRSIELDVFSLEDALSHSNIPAIDFLSLDVQGAEYDILESAKKRIQQDCVGIQLEVEFVQLYRDQKMFADIHCLMESMGFELLDLGSFGRCAPMSLPIGFRGVEQPLYAEAVYIKKMDPLVEEKNIDQLYKGALFSLIYKKLGLCFKFLSKIAEISALGGNCRESPLYIQCLTEIWLLFEASKHIKLPQLSQLFSNERFQNYYGRKANATDVIDKMSAIKHHMRQLLPMVERCNAPDSSPLEDVLKKYGLDDVAEVARQNRVFEANCFAELMK